MAKVEISHNDFEEARSILHYGTSSNPLITGRMRWWKPLDGPPVLQCEWSGRGGIGPNIWIAVPTITEIPDA